MNSAENGSAIGEDSEDDFDWEEVEVAQPAATLSNASLGPATAASIQDYYGEPHDREEGPSERPHLEITIKTKGKAKGDQKNARAVQLAAERAVRLECHKIHTVVLLMNAKVRNKWLNDPLLHARLMSLTPLALQNAFTMIHKSRVPEAAKRGRLFESAVARLADWWASTFEVVSTGHLRSRTFEDVQKTLPPPRRTAPPPDPKGKGKARAVEEDDEDEDAEARYGVAGEKIRSEKSLMKHALMRRGTRDTSAQLFTALCRAMGIPARLVVSLQSVPWQAGVGKPKPSAKKKAKPKVKAKPDEEVAKGRGRSASIAPQGKKHTNGTDGDDQDDDDMEEVAIPSSPAGGSSRARTPFPGDGKRLDGASPATTDKGKGKQKAPPVIKLRKSKGGQKLGSAADRAPRRERTPEPTESAPVFWTEVFSRADAKWIPVDPVRVIVNRRKAFDPTPNPNAAKPDRRRPVRVENRMVYVLAFEEDGHARDVTPRYAREYGAKVAKVQQGGRGRREWWERICRMVQRPYRLQRDDLEDEELQAHQMTEAMPTTMAGFKDHPLYALARHLKRDEVVEPPVELGKFRGEPVYPRVNVLQLKTAENWMRQGRTVAAGAQPLKWVKQRAVTVHKKRAIELALADRRERAASASTSVQAVGDEEDTGGGGAEEDMFGLATAGEGFASEDGVMQGLYAEHQTELYKPPPVVNGKVPKNDFGNLDLYVPTMLPAGAAHIPCKGTAKIARQLGFDYAEAVTGFEFKKRRAFPVITGIVVAAENESALLEAYWAAEQEADAKRRAKRREQVLKRWTKLVQGLRIRQRLLEQYADRAPDASTSADADANAAGDHQRVDEGSKDEQRPAAAGGFLAGVDDVVQPYALPRAREIIEHASTRHAALGELQHTAEGVPRERDEHDGEAFLSDTLEVIEADDANEHEEDDDGAMVDMEDVDVPRLNGAPKTMQELAEEAARRFRADEESKVPDNVGPAAAASSSSNGRETRSSRASTNANGKAPSAATPAKPVPRRGRKRTRAQAEDMSDSDAGPVAGGSAVGQVVDQGGAQEQEASSAQPSGPSPPAPPAKKARGRVRAAPAPPPPPTPSTRVLRTRKPKDASTVQEERELEAVYRRAVAG